MNVLRILMTQSLVKKERIIAHEAVHAMQSFGITEARFNNYRELATQELSDILDHRFVTRYVDHHHNIYKSNEHETLGEDFAEAVRIYLTNVEFLRRHFPRRHQFIQDEMPFVQENAIQKFVANRS